MRYKRGKKKTQKKLVSQGTTLNPTKFPISLTKEYQEGTKPLHVAHLVPKEKDGAQDREKLPGGGDDGAGQRSKVNHRHENEGLASNREPCHFF